MTTDRKLHIVGAEIDNFGDLRFTLTCPDDESRDRPCLMVAEPDRCDFIDWEDGEHHWDCAARRNRNNACSGGDREGVEGAPGCWIERPDECDGVDHPEFRHGHPVKGCWANEVISDVGWDDGVTWKDLPPAVIDGVPLPMEVFVYCDDEGVTLTPAHQDPGGDFERWILHGQQHGWIADGVCQTHDLTPMTDDETSEFDRGFDPCIPILRVWMERV